jgi:hypothetical protein
MDNKKIQVYMSYVHGPGQAWKHMACQGQIQKQKCFIYLYYRYNFFSILDNILFPHTYKNYRAAAGSNFWTQGRPDVKLARLHMDNSSFK